MMRLTQPNAATLAKMSDKMNLSKTESKLIFEQTQKKIPTTAKKNKKTEKDDQETEMSQLQNTLKKEDDLPMSDIFASPAPVTSKKTLLDNGECVQHYMSPQPIQPNRDEQL